MELRPWLSITNSIADDTDKVAVLFVSEEKLEDFKSIKMQSTDSGPRMTVDNDFVYGQQKDGNHRFLVFHDTSRAMFQVNPKPREDEDTPILILYHHSIVLLKVP